MERDIPHVLIYYEAGEGTEIAHIQENHLMKWMIFLICPFLLSGVPFPHNYEIYTCPRVCIIRYKISYAVLLEIKNDVLLS